MGQGTRVTDPPPGGMGWVGPGRQGNGPPPGGGWVGLAQGARVTDPLPPGGGWVGYQNTHPYGQSRFEGNLSGVTIAERQGCNGQGCKAHGCKGN